MARGGKLALLAKILPEFQFMVFDIVKKGLPVFILSELNKQITYRKDINEETFDVKGNPALPHESFAAELPGTAQGQGRRGA